MPTVLTIAGLDPSGGAGIIADVRAFTEFGCAPAAAITAVTFQNDKTVSGVEALSAEIIRNQVLAVIEHNSVAGVKTGMLPTVDAVREVVRLCGEGLIPTPIVDPVLQSTSGYSLMENEAIPVLIRELIPMARLVTPNIPEAERLTGLRITDLDGMREAATAFRRLGAKSVLIKGGHLGPGPEAIDFLDDDGDIKIFRGKWIPNAKCRGTGCKLSAAITACLANGRTMPESVEEAKRFVAREIMGTVAGASSND